jgi:glycosyltransferase involved in cell wall biosynthesis
MTAIEALACGSPVVASRVGGLKSSVVENKVGALFEPRDAEDLAENIKLLFDQPGLKEEYRKNARPYVVEKFSWEAVSKAAAAVYQELMTG